MPERIIIYGLGERLASLRKNHKMTQQEVAAKLGVSSKSISKFENDTLTPSLDNIIKFAIMYNVTTDSLLGLGKDSFLYLAEFTDKQREYLLNIITGLKEVIADEGTR